MNPSPFHLAHQAWLQSASFRQQRHRYKQYTYGRQWGDIVADVDGTKITEGDLAAKSGQFPLTNNMIRQLVKCVIGNFRSTLAQNDPAAFNAPSAEVASRNALTELDCRMLEEFLISGCAIQRIVAEKRMDGEGVWIDNVSPDNFFVNRFSDPRGLDIELIGMLHALSPHEMAMRFASNPKALAAIKRAYADMSMAEPIFGIATSPQGSFHSAPDGKMRLIEVWTLESRNILKCHDPLNGRMFISTPAQTAEIDSVNACRSACGEQPITSCPSTTLRWHCRFYAPSGTLIDEFDSPYAHGKHPFAVKFYPLIDGEVHSLVEDIIDQQRHINRLITLLDHIMSVSAKGVLLYPIDQKPDGLSWKDIGSMWARCNSILPYDANRSVGEPKQIISSADNAGAYQLINLQMQLFQQISGVTDALQGRIDTRNPSAALFDSQLRSATVALLDLLDSFNSFRQSRNAIIATI